ncbi:uncharacterized protein MONOS_8818 [Monocercomonoides exilis]|uniref:uncharacterized protein n=1 Tax=Monocercomonoides exilis TaxID=2049356 RepID=UPI003559458B|nr:hypothetical protein MONOS_8818 [Monocercomonoides exilis]|eukprot:MONOS_8818.1-p1 / transcript=MONOS_8818.1 / gene=MONOS_8818 / organism=Monocercomonoides_exilis_PA203 / gene_product=unspecified product / transcript_product=unspecified product / location=Mono_scaffold00343:48240-48587(+) / protein_length=92 / sequence_SO=supercontig / SO=protein_coding / is_pseudo=false
MRRGIQLFVGGRQQRWRKKSKRMLMSYAGQGRHLLQKQNCRGRKRTRTKEEGKKVKKREEEGGKGCRNESGFGADNDGCESIEIILLFFRE